jgi:nitric oxide reductase large subunit
MSTAVKPLPELVQELPPYAQKVVRDFVEFLLTKHGPKPGKKLWQDWAGALRDYRDQYTALDLQRKALEWRGEM